MGRPLRTRLDLLKPNHESQVVDQQAQQKANHDRHSKEQELTDGQFVLAKNFCSGLKWMPGVIVEVLGPLSYHVKLTDRQILKQHADHLLHHTGINDNDELCRTQLNDEIPSGPIPQEGSPQETSSTISVDREAPVSNANSTGENDTTSNTTPLQTEQHCYPKCQNCRKPARYTT